ncbi:hypothetical protein PJF56_09765 [Roseofilum sp. BLCC_M91]|uniref:Translation initiation factor IF-2 n=1 Tax=Roseofilum halophilum BLCC-M91 TaxID=3022259 RepID=A0ABT7BK44_9CYAN|nr:hypothetical protein [Roseofilum halophilum]MDJ1179152.1 hypothetical protein [Roseofilum halophilum BLCC-M91]
MAFLKNLFGGKKKSDNFQVQFDDTPKTETQPVASPAPEAPKAPEAPAQAPAPAAKTEAPAKTTAKKEGKKTKTFRKAKQKAAPEQATPAAKPVAQPKVAAVAKPAQPVVEEGFATKYMNTGLGQNMSRRRPGPNMKGFLEMARKAKN